MKIRGMMATAADQPLRVGEMSLRDVQDNDVLIDILYCGVCHSDLHMARNEWGVSQYPLVPGHEIVGRVRQSGKAATRFTPGQLVGVGVMVDSCGQCAFCQQHEEQYCDSGFTPTYNGTDRYTGELTCGGYAQNIVVDQRFVVSVPENLDPAGVAPLLCAGVTVWSPLRYFDVKPGDRVGVIGLGGLGHMAVKLASALGAEVTLFTTSPEKGEDARRLGASRVVISRDSAQMAACATSLDIILDCVAAPHDLDPYLAALKTNGRLVLVGIPDSPHPAPDVTPLVFRRLSISGTSIGSIQETQQMLDFCGQHNITADIEMIRGEEVEAAFSRMLKGEVKYRFVIDMAATAL
ncbi:MULTISPECIES: NAD(P)-dependent alcohol dehydrogenase [Enterobacteriaceae]|uniref:NAD(P)-dependent alcohol dehydrogenase n=1 Tax=Raoultella lignicola TaxID=3040939 RepID=A0ABU9FFB7_9ENTR|nr:MULTISPECIES: NAD(P)-dependent alcohol dehydrogenase [Enterobacteriaceae]MRT47339.1 alcohol dehydrogenase catalytic domain-containing protein [Raoultella sp. RIT712]QNK09725.1 NAD(P)-dependent alcohol dehydrogenase [Enterobacter sp. JUb54]ROS15009.1 putative zinc-type alcohol dehydrogenase-like protein [Raoultella sp. BIGb0399]